MDEKGFAIVERFKFLSGGLNTFIAYSQDVWIISVLKVSRQFVFKSI